MTFDHREEDGGITVLSLFLLVAMLLAAGLALDTANAVKTRVNLQIAADMAGHAAILTARTEGHENAKEKAVELAALNAPPNARATVLASTDIEFGTWNEVDRTFSPDAGSSQAVRATARMHGSENNGLRTFLMKLIGIEQLDITASSTWVNGPSPCVNGGFAANGIVKARSNGKYGRGFCMHSNTHVELQQNNEFADGTTVSMPDLADLGIPASGLEKNPGLPEALRPDTNDLSEIFDNLSTTASDYADPAYADQPDYITSGKTSEIEVAKGGGNDKGKKADSTGDDTEVTFLKASDLTSNAVNIVKCNGKGITIGTDEVIRDVVIVTECSVQFSAGAALEDSVLVTTSTDKFSIKAPSGFRLGKNDQCAPGGEATIITLGGMSVAAGFEAYGGQVIAQGNIGFTANANGIEGINLISDGEIDGTSNGDMGFCPDEGMANTVTIDEVRMVQ